MNKYISIKTIVSIITGFLIYICLSFIGLDHAIMWALIAFFLNYIPNIGSIIASIPAIIIALIQFNIYYALLVALVYLIINIVMGSIVEPKYLGKELGLSTLIIFSDPNLPFAAFSMPLSIDDMIKSLSIDFSKATASAILINSSLLALLFNIFFISKKKWAEAHF